MCGIGGIIANQQFAGSVGKIANILLEGNKHRGPYFHGIQTLGNATFIHTRIPTQSGKDYGQQPMVFGKLLLTYNGDIYPDGIAQLRTLTGEHGDGSDTSLLIAGMVKSGVDVVKHIGTTNEFAFCVYNRENDTILAARDWSGNRPLFYLQDSGNQAFLFSSVALPLITCLRKGYCEGEIKELPPGHYLEGHISRLTVSPLPKSSFAVNTDSPFDDFVHQFYAVIEDAIRLRVPPRPFGVKVSGGLDSITALHIGRKVLIEQERDPHDIVPLTFGKPQSPDVQAALSYYKAHDINNFILISADEQELFDSIPDVVEIVESNHLNHIRIGAINKVIAQKAFLLGLPIVLSGEGVEEVFGSYPDVFLAGYHPLVEKFYPNIRGMDPDAAFTMMWKLFYSQRALTERWRTDRIMTGTGINDRPYITDRRIEDTVERLYGQRKIAAYFRYVEPGKPITDKYIFRLAMRQFGGLERRFAFRPKLQTVVGSGMGTHDPMSGLFSSMARGLGFATLQEYVDNLFQEYGFNIPALQHPEREMTKILGSVAEEFIVPARSSGYSLQL